LRQIKIPIDVEFDAKLEGFFIANVTGLVQVKPTLNAPPFTQVASDKSHCGALNGLVSRGHVEF
jgi:hypothetical protein